MCEFGSGDGRVKKEKRKQPETTRQASKRPAAYSCPPFCCFAKLMQCFLMAWHGHGHGPILRGYFLVMEASTRRVTRVEPFHHGTHTTHAPPPHIPPTPSCLTPLLCPQEEAKRPRPASY